VRRKQEMSLLPLALNGRVGLGGEGLVTSQVTLVNNLILIEWEHQKS